MRITGMFLRTGRLFVLAFEEIGGVVQPCGIVALAQGVHAVFEVVEILAVVGPAHLGDGGQTQAAGCMVHKLVPPYHFRSFFLYRQLYMNLPVSSTIRNRIHACP